MRIAYVSFNYKSHETHPGSWLGKIRFYNGALEALAKYATVYNIDLINWEGELSQNGVQYIFPGRKSIFTTLKKISPDVLIVHGLVTPLKVIQLRFRLGRKRIFVQHHAERPLKGIKAMLQRFADRYVENYFFSSDAMAGEWIKQRLVDRAKIKAIPEASSVFSIGDKKLARTKDKDPGKLKYLWVGRLNVNKDPLTVAKAFTRFAMNNERCILYMICSTDELQPALTETINTGGMSNNIRLIPRLPHYELEHRYNDADFIINSSYYEGCNIAVLEGMSCGCIPIVTRIPSFELHTNQGRIGLQFKPGDVQGLLECLNQSTQMDIRSEQEKVLDYFQEHLSFTAIAAKVHSVVCNHAG